MGGEPVGVTGVGSELVGVTGVGGEPVGVTGVGGLWVGRGAYWRGLGVKPKGMRGRGCRWVACCAGVEWSWWAAGWVGGEDEPQKAMDMEGGGCGMVVGLMVPEAPVGWGEAICDGQLVQGGVLSILQLVSLYWTGWRRNS